MKPKRNEVAELSTEPKPAICITDNQVDYQGSNASENNESEPAARQNHMAGLNQCLCGEEREQVES